MACSNTMYQFSSVENSILSSDTATTSHAVSLLPMKPEAANKSQKGVSLVEAGAPRFLDRKSLVELVSRPDSSLSIAEQYAKMDTIHYSYSSVDESWTQALHLSFKNNGSHPDWLIIVYVLIVGLFASIRITGSGFLAHLFESLLSYNAWSKLYKLRNPQTEKLSFVFNIFFILVYSLLAYHACVASNWMVFNLHNFQLLALLTGVVTAFYISKYIIFRFFGYLSQESELAEKILHCIFSILKVSGVAILPFVIAQPYMQPAVGRYFILFSELIMAISYVLLFVRSTQIFLYNKVSILYQIVYFCALELVPMLMVYKFISTNIK